MINFKMKIIGFSGGTYNVEYIPEREGCKPIKLNIQLDQDSLNDENRILERLKASSPQDYWYDQILAHESDNVNQVAKKLINKEYKVNEFTPLPVNPVNSFSFHPVPAPIRGPNLDRAPQPALPTQQASAVTGSSTPEQVANPEHQNIIKLKILIQQVIQEMADGTV